MAVPAHDQRDFEFAKAFDLDIIPVVDVPDVDLDNLTEAAIAEGTMINSGEYSGMNNKEAIKKITEDLEEKGLGHKTVNYKLRDWLISRQRYWGTPIPMIYCEKCGWVPEDEHNLPVLLPTDVEFTGKGDSPLTTSKTFRACKCPKCGGDAEREIDTMDTFLDSSWYFLRYCEEPFRNLLTQGMVIKGYNDSEGNYVKAKMSKSLGNVVSPAEIQAKYGSDTARLFILFAAPPEKELDWSDEGVEGSYRFLNRVYRLVCEYINDIRGDQREFAEPVVANSDDKNLNYMINVTIKKVSEDAGGRFNFNTAIASIMELVNEMYKYKQSAEMNLPLFNKAIETLLVVLNPFTPHITEEMWNQLGHEDRLYSHAWPACDESALVKDEIEIIVQVNGKLKDKLLLPNNSSKEVTEQAARELEKVKEATEGKNIVKVIVVPNRIVNFVVK